MADQTIDLGDNTVLQIAVNDGSGASTLSLYQGKSLIQAVTIGNAVVDPAAVVAREFCSGCPLAYFVPARDRTSTYGAVTGVMAYKLGAWWSFSILPLAVAGVAGPDSTGVFWLTDTTKTDRKTAVRNYAFGSDGILRKR